MHIELFEHIPSPNWCLLTICRFRSSNSPKDCARFGSFTVYAGNQSKFSQHSFIIVPNEGGWHMPVDVWIIFQD